MPFRPDRPEDFFVEEIPAYVPAGEGDHCFLLVEKRNLSTAAAIGRLCAVVGRRPEEVGAAGQKDKVAIARQWLSVPGVDPAVVEGLMIDDGKSPDDPERAYLRVISAARHGNKLRTGHLLGNRFKITVRDRPPLADRLDELVRAGLPNRYGGQRFARNNVETGRAVLAGEAGGLDPQRKRMAVSALQSLAFNAVLEERASSGLLSTAIEGDLLEDGVPTGPMPGWKMERPAAGTAARELEDAVLARLAVRCEDFRAVGKIGVGTRRPLIAQVEDAYVDVKDSGAQVVAFRLPPGGYATVLMEALGCGTD